MKPLRILGNAYDTKLNDTKLLNRNINQKTMLRTTYLIIITSFYTFVLIIDF